MALDIKGNVKFFELIPAEQLSSTETGTGVDLKDYEGRCTAYVTVGVVSGTSPTADVKIQDSADDSTFADVTGLTFTQLTAAGREELAVPVRDLRRYVRAVATLAGTSPVFDLAVVLAAVPRVKPPV